MAHGGKRQGAGRKVGSVNKIGADVRALAQKYTGEAVEMLASIARDGESEQARVSAIKELLDRGYGKATQVIDAEVKGRIIIDVDLS